MFKTSCVLVRMDFAYNKYPRQRGLLSHVTDIPEAGLRALSSTSECQSSGSAPCLMAPVGLQSGCHSSSVTMFYEAAVCKAGHSLHFVSLNRTVSRASWLSVPFEPLAMSEKFQLHESCSFKVELQTLTFPASFQIFEFLVLEFPFSPCSCSCS